MSHSKMTCPEGQLVFTIRQKRKKTKTKGPRPLAETPGPAAKEPGKKDPSAEKKSVAVDLELSVEDIDKVLAEEDPEFLNQLNQVSQDKNLSLPSIEISDEDQALNNEKDAWAQSGKIGRTVFRAFPAIARVSLAFKKNKFKFIAFYQDRKVRTKNFLYFLMTTGREKAKEATQRRIITAKEKFRKASDKYRYMSALGKLMVTATFLLAIGTFVFIYLSLTRGIFRGETNLFVTSLESVADDVYTTNPEDEREPFYDNLRMGNHLFLIPKIVVNLKKSTKSSDTPMGAFEFYIEGTNQDVLIEIKDREVEIRDLMYRTIEDFTFEQADSPEGKEQMTEKLRKEVNMVLTQGKIRKVWLKTAIVKP